ETWGLSSDLRVWSIWISDQVSPGGDGVPTGLKLLLVFRGGDIRVDSAVLKHQARRISSSTPRSERRCFEYSLTGISGALWEGGDWRSQRQDM
ncbi:unnamed protein product, partial [Linum tenue]